MTKIILIAAKAANGIIGCEGDLPWKGQYKKDLLHFRKVTKGHPIIMGRKTWDSLPKKPLPYRTNIVLSRTSKFTNSHTVFFVDSLEKAIEKASSYSDEIFIIGGAKVYEEALPLATHMWLTDIYEEYKGDVYFPEFNTEDWVSLEDLNFEGFTISFYQKLSASASK